MMVPTPALLEQVEQLCECAGVAIMDVYQRRELWSVTYKSDASPVTAADMAAHHILVPGLSRLLPEVPVLSEESALPDFEVRRQWHTYWLVDPLDGTKEFINRNDEFTVNVALIHLGEPVLGVVHVPALLTTYSGIKGEGARKRSGTWSGNSPTHQSIRTRGLVPRQAAGLPLEMVASRRHGTEAVQRVKQRLTGNYGPVTTRDIGSSLKICLVAEGEADIYPRLAPTCEWDTAAAQAVVEAAGGAILTDDFKPLRYNQKLELLNPHFYVVGDLSIPWRDWLG